MTIVSVLLCSCKQETVNPKSVEWFRMADYPIIGTVVEFDPVAGIAYAMPAQPSLGTVDVYSMDLEENFWVKCFSFENKSIISDPFFLKNDFGGVYLYTYSENSRPGQLWKLDPKQDAELIVEGLEAKYGSYDAKFVFNRHGDLVIDGQFYSASKEVIKTINGSNWLSKRPMVLNDEFFFGSHQEFAKLNTETMELEQLYYPGGPERFLQGDFFSWGYYGPDETVYTLGKGKIIHWNGTTPTQYPFTWEPYAPQTAYSVARAGDRLYVMMHQGNSAINLEEIYVFDPTDTGYTMVKVTDELEGLGTEQFVGTLHASNGKLYANFKTGGFSTSSRTFPLYRIDF